MKRLEEEIKEQEVKETQQVNPVEVRIIKQIRYLPEVFMIRTKWGQVIKISVTDSNYVNCSKYVSKSKLTFNGCFKFDKGKLEESRGIYYTPVAPLFSLNFRGKITRDLEEMRSFILRTIELLSFNSEKLLIVYDNYAFSVYDKFVKGKLYEFNQWYEQGHLFIYNVPSPKYAEYLEFEDTNEINIYNHVIKTNVNIKVYRLYVSAGMAYLIYVPEYVMLTIKSPDHDEKTVDLYNNNYYIMAHPVPTRKVD